MSDSTRWDNVRSAVERCAQSGTVGVALVAPGGERWSHNGARQFRAASVVKIPLMVEVFRAIERGERSLNDAFVVTDAEKAPGSGVLLHMHDGLRVTLNDLIY